MWTVNTLNLIHTDVPHTWWSHPRNHIAWSFHHVFHLFTRALKKEIPVILGKATQHSRSCFRCEGKLLISLPLNQPVPGGKMKAEATEAANTLHSALCSMCAHKHYYLFDKRIKICSKVSLFCLNLQRNCFSEVYCSSAHFHCGTSQLHINAVCKQTAPRWP